MFIDLMRAYKLILVHNFYFDSLHRLGTSHCQVVIIPMGLICLGIFASFGLYDFLSSCYSHIATVHISKSFCTSTELGCFKPKVNHICLLFSKGSLEKDKPCLFTIKVHKTPKVGFLDWRWAPLLLRGLHFLLGRTHFEGVEVGVQIYDAIANDIIRADAAVHDLNFKASTEMFIVAVNKELALVFEFRVLATILHYFSVVGLIGELQADVGIHG